MSSPTNSQTFWTQMSNVAGAYLGALNAPNPISTTYFDVMTNMNLYGTSTPIGETALSQKLASTYFNSSTTTNLVSFVNTFYTKVLGYPDTSSIPASAYDPANAASPLYGVYQTYLFVTGINNGTNTDLSIIQDPNTSSQFSALFTDFIKNFSYSVLPAFGTPFSSKTINGTNYEVQNDSNFSANYENFWKQYVSYLSVTSVVQTSSKDFIANNPTDFTHNNTVSEAVQYIQSYQTIYESFNGSIGTLSTNPSSWTVAQQVFVQRLTDFYNSELTKTATSADPAGFFDPSQALPDWYNYTQNLYYNPQYTPNAITADPNSTLILDKVLQLIIDMIGTIQTVAAAQSNQLNFLSQWQTAYTNKLNQIHTFAQGDGTVIDNSEWNDKASQQIRNDLNNVNQNYISKLQANQQTISDTSKSLQSNVNQSNDAANQQASMADSILQEMSTIISAIFK